MFQNPRYLTKGVQHGIPLDIQTMLWQLIDKRVASGAALDYLQVFRLTAKGSATNPVQHIVHHQEQPDYLAAYAIEHTNPITAKIFCIDDGAQTTMLLADEY